MRKPYPLPCQFRAAGFSGQACAITTASASMLTEWLAGRSLDEVLRAEQAFRTLLSDHHADGVPDLGDLVHLQAVSHFPARVRNALLPWSAVIKALDR